MATDDPTKLIKELSLPTALRGYDRAATDRFLSDLEDSVTAVLTERNEAQARVAELEKQIAEGREHEKEITEALLVASRVRAESEREGKELKAEYEREAESATAESKRQADEIVRGAEAEAEKMLEDARLKVRGFEQEIRDAEQLAVEARARIAAFLESLLAELDPDGTGLGSPVDELLTRIGEAVKADPGEIGDQPKAPSEGSRQPRTLPRAGESREDGGG